ncbi:MAG: PD-(D/E)XK nuclease family protein [Cyanobacteria bacterium]|jgi:ATP-dependent helicase/DNAse subunit B|nr:PD-(D/E)XK nuclease family protein [Cyanobacteria bacterium GSL.Bin21]
MSRSLHLSFSLPDLDYGQFKVITPTRPVARALQKRHQSLENLAKTSIQTQGWKVASPLMTSRILRQSVKEVFNSNDVEGTARTIKSSVQELLRSQLDLEALKKHSSPRVQALANLTQFYQSQLSEQGYIDPASLFGKATELDSISYRCLFYGYFTPQWDELVLINQIAADGSVFLLPCEETELFISNQKAIDFLKNQGWEIIAPHNGTVTTFGEQLQTAWIKQTDISDSVQAHVYLNLEAEVRGVLAQVKQLLSQGIPPQEIVLVARDEPLYGSLLIDIAWEYQLPIRALYRISLQETRIGSWLKLLMEVIQNNFPFEATAKLLNHPLVSYLSASVWEQARQIHPQGWQAWSQLGLDLDLLNLPRSARRDEWVERFQKILDCFQVRDRAKHWAREIVAFYKLQDTLVELSKPETEFLTNGHPQAPVGRSPCRRLFNSGVRMTQDEFIEELQEILTLINIPVQPGRGGIELHSPKSLEGASYQYVFVLGMAEGCLPAPLKQDSILDFHERKQLAQAGFHLETAVEATRREELSFYHLLGVPKKALIVSYAQIMGTEAALPSPYLKRFNLTPSVPPKTPLASLEEVRRVYLSQDLSHVLLPVSDPVWEKAQQTWKVEQQRESAETHDEYDGVVNLELNPAERTFSASQLLHLGQCPFRWFSEKVLRLKEESEAELGLSHSLKGQLYHRCLELLFGEMQTQKDLTQQALESAFLQAEKDIHLPSIPGWEAQRQECLTELYLNFHNSQFLSEEVEIADLETDFEIDWYGLTVKGRIDRIDRCQEGLVVIDYKTSSQTPSGVKDDQGKLSLDLQLPLYLDAIPSLYPEEAAQDAVYYSLTKHKNLSSLSKARKKPDPETLSNFADHVQTTLQTGNYPVDPDPKQDACRYCPFDVVCRRGTRLTRKSSFSNS